MSRLTITLSEARYRALKEASAQRDYRAAALADFEASAAILEEFEARPQLARVLRGCRKRPGGSPADGGSRAA